MMAAGAPICKRPFGRRPRSTLDDALRRSGRCSGTVPLHMHPCRAIIGSPLATQFAKVTPVPVESVRPCLLSVRCLPAPHYGACFGCAAVPTIPEPLTLRRGRTQRSGHGRARPTLAAGGQSVLKRLAAQAPDAGALERHLAVEQAVAGAPLYTGNRVTILRDGRRRFAAIFARFIAASTTSISSTSSFEDVELQR